MKRLSLVVISIIVILTFGFSSFALTAVKSLGLNSTYITLEVGKAYTLKATVSPANASNKKVTFTSENGSIATVDKNGVIKAIQDGTTIITVISSADNKITATCNVTVKPRLPRVNLIYYTGVAAAQASQPTKGDWNKAINAELLKKINATVEVNTINMADYGQKMNLLMASGVKIDMMTTVGLSDTVPSLASKGWFLESESLFKKYAPKSYESLGKYWDLARVNGKIYTMANELMWALEEGFEVKEDIAQKVGFDQKDKTIKFEDIEPYLAKVKDTMPGIIPLLLNSTAGAYINSPIYELGYWPLTRYAAVKVDDKTMKINNWYSTPEFKARLDLLHQWYLKGYINKDAATLKDLALLKKTAFATFGSVHINNGIENMAQSQASWGGHYFMTATSPTYLSGSTVQSIGVAIAKTSKNPERSAMFLELTHSDKDFIHLFIYGGKDVNYMTDKEDIYYTPIPTNSFLLSDYLQVNCHLKLLAPGQPKDAIQNEIKTNERAITPGYAGFTVDSNPIKTENANCQAVCDEFLPALTTGTVDPGVELPKFLDKLKAAGIDRIISETQAQLDKWKAAVGK